MKNQPAMLAAVATFVLVCTIARLTSTPDLDAGGVEPRPTAIAARMEALGSAPDLAPINPLAADPRPPGRASLASVPIVVEPADASSKEAARAGVEVRRWPDGAPLDERTVEIFSSPGLPIREYLTTRDGFVSLDIDTENLPIDLHILADGFEAGEVQITAETPHPVVELRPLEGWYGRVLSMDSEPVAGVWVSGWWIETARPFGDNAFETRRVKEEKAEEPPPVGELPSDFVSAQGEQVATTVTNAEGYYYIEPLEADVRGEMTLLVADRPDVSSDVLREALPRADPLLPDIILHRPRRLHGVVVDLDGRPISEAVVICRLQRGWSPDLLELRTDEAGQFEVDQPVEPIVLTVEKTGYSLVGDAPEQLESADGMWRALAAMGKQFGDPAYLFSRAYGQWANTLFPRARPVVAVTRQQSDIRLVMRPRSRFAIYVFDRHAKILTDPAIAEARITVTYGGLDANTVSLTTGADGTAKAPSVDLAWQPMVVRAQADGFLPQQTIVPLGTMDLQFGLIRRGAANANSGSAGDGDEDGLVGQVTGLLPTEKAQLVIYHSARSESRQEVIWSGETQSGGRFHIEDWLTLSKRNRYLFAYIDAAPGDLPSSRRAGVVGPLPPFMTRTVALPIEAAAPMTLHLGQFDSDTPHRIQVSYAPFVGAATAMLETIDLTHAPSWASAHEIHAPHGWAVRAHVERQIEDNVPIVDFLRKDRRQPLYKSLATTWTDWVAASETALLRYAYSDAHLFVVAPGMVSLSGSVDGLPSDPPTLTVAALGQKGQWLSRVSSTGWFSFPELPAGRIHLLLYSPPDNESGFTLTDEGSILGSLRVNCTNSRDDALLPWQGQ